MTTTAQPSHIDDPAAWRGASFDGPQAYTVHLGDIAVNTLGQLKGDAFDIEHPQPPLPAKVAAQLATVEHELRAGRGFVLLRGLPFDRWSVDQARAATWAIAHAVGIPMSQTAAGARLVDVMDTSGKEATPRQFSTSRELRLHTDPASDLIGLACVRTARSGGDSVLVSSVTVHNEMLAQRPDLLGELYKGFHWHRFEEGRPQDAPVTVNKVPVFSVVDNKLSCRYVRSAIVAGQKDAGEPLTPVQIEALDLLDSLAASPRLRVAFRMQAGDVMLVNNLTVMHARTEFVDHDEPDKARLLLRLWLQGKNGFRPMRKELNYFNGGECGIPAAQGMQSRYDMQSLYADPASGGAAHLGVSS